MPYLSASVVVFHYDEALYEVYAPLSAKIQGLCLSHAVLSKLAETVLIHVFSISTCRSSDLNNWSHSGWQAICAGKLNRTSFIHDNYAQLLNSE